MPLSEGGRAAAFEGGDMTESVPEKAAREARVTAGPPQTLGEEADEQLKLILPPDDGMSLGEWIEWMPKDTQYRCRRLAIEGEL